jgi:cytochrome aa3-600 menaquinol oxidase subunit 4
MGFLLSVLLTLMALWISFYSGFSKQMILLSIFGFAFFQAIIQLLLFMHMREGTSGKIQTGTMIYAAFIAIVVVIGSVWVLSIGHMNH